MLEILRNVILIVLVGFMVNRLFSTMVALVAILPVIIVILLVFSRRLHSFYTRIEKRFITNLNQREQDAADAAASDLSPWDAHMVLFTLPAESAVVGKTLQELAWREQYGINIAYIERGTIRIKAPTRTDVLYPFDELAVIGTDVQLEQFRTVLDGKTLLVPGEEAEITLNRFIVDGNSALRGKTIRASGIRENTSGLVVGIERNGQRLLNPDSTTIFERNDIVWIVGDRKKIEELRK